MGGVVACVSRNPLQVIDPDTSGKQGILFPADATGFQLGPAVRVACAGNGVFSTHGHKPGTAHQSVVCWRPTGRGAFGVSWSIDIENYLMAIAASSDGRFVATTEYILESGSGRNVPALVIRDATTGEVRHEITNQVLPWGIRDRLRFSPDGSRVMAVRDDAVNLWDTATGKHAARLPVPNISLSTDAVFHPSGRWILTSGIDARVRVWDADQLTEVNAFQWGVGTLRSVAVGADGTVAAAGGEDGNIVVWDLDL